MMSRLLKGAASVAAAVLFATALVLTSRPAVAQQPPPAASQSFDFAARSKEVVAYVGGVIRFYQESTTPIQKVGEPNDIVYRDQAVALSTQAATLAFQFARAECCTIS